MDLIPAYGTPEHNNSTVISSHVIGPNTLSSTPSHTSNPPILPLHENTVLTWDGEELYGPEPAVFAQTASSSQALRSPLPPPIPTILPPRSPSPPERPPEYAEAQKPTKNVCYSFSPMANNAMVLIPPADAQDTRPQYYITVSMNCFMPLSHITTIYRGANEYGSSVAEFEMGIIAASNRFRIKDRIESITSFLTKDGSRTQAIWRWTIPGPANQVRKRLVWDYARRPCVVSSYPMLEIERLLVHGFISAHYFQDLASWLNLHLSLESMFKSFFPNSK
ncbi:hypothetical protein BDN70DRAFT_889188 [Pholiota conissans]|uniref:Uncharacterized protein n=1 Tax=Pholiota conissans TaxID=109636 RepID=A0A9P5YME8_9AGAR|nr:hypothetical protein BDN70DRAFT_889188 [Pholiota conissans]